MDAANLGPHFMNHCLEVTSHLYFQFPSLANLLFFRTWRAMKVDRRRNKSEFFGFVFLFLWLIKISLVRVKIHRKRMQIGSGQGLGGWRMGNNCLMGTWFPFRVMIVYVLELGRGDVCTTYRECTKCRWMVHFEMVNFMLCEFCLN